MSTQSAAESASEVRQRAQALANEKMALIDLLDDAKQLENAIQELAQATEDRTKDLELAAERAAVAAKDGASKGRWPAMATNIKNALDATREALDAARETTTDRTKAAIAGGWTKAELTSLGLIDKRSPRTPRSKKRTTTEPAPTTTALPAPSPAPALTVPARAELPQ